MQLRSTHMTDAPKPNRRERYALATKEAIVDAARKLFAERGYFATTVEDIAVEADVAPATVYSSTGGKQGLLAELLRLWSEDPTIQATLDTVAATNDPQEVIGRLASAAAEMREAWDDLVRVFLATAPHDASVAKQLAPFTAFYRQCIVDIAQRLVELGAVREGVDAAYAADVLWLYFGYGSLYTLHHENGWSYARAEQWLAEQACRALLADPQSDG
jgi:AcrR family transcriptional regulator